MSAKSFSEDYPTFTEHENEVIGKYNCIWIKYKKNDFNCELFVFSFSYRV